MILRLVKNGVFDDKGQPNHRQYEIRKNKSGTMSHEFTQVPWKKTASVILRHLRDF